MGACNSKKNGIVAREETTIAQMTKYGDIPQNGVQGAGYQPSTAMMAGAQARPSVQFLNPAMDPSAQLQSASRQFGGMPSKQQMAPSGTFAPSVAHGPSGAFHAPTNPHAPNSVVQARGDGAAAGAAASSYGDVGVSLGGPGPWASSSQFANQQWDTMSQAQAACDQYNNRKLAYPGSSLFPQARGQAVVRNPSSGFVSAAVKQPTPSPSVHGSEALASRPGKPSSGKTSSKAKKSSKSKGTKKKSSKSKKSKSKRTKSKRSKSKK